MSKNKERNLSEKEEFALQLIMQACDLMKWTIAVPGDKEGQPIYYLIIGTDEGVDTAMARINGEGH